MNTGIDKDVNKVKNNDTDDGWFNYTGQEEEDNIPRNTTKVRIDPSVKVIENKLFHKLWKRNVKLEDVILGDGVEHIHVEAFFDRCTLSSINPNFTKNKYRFLRSVVVPSTVKTIGRKAFYRCQQLEEVTLCEGLERIGKEAFAKTSIKCIYLPSTIKIIDTEAFNDCSNLEKVVFSESATGKHHLELRSGIFYRCNSLQSINIPSSVTEISELAFSSCTDLKKITLHSGITSLGTAAFSDSGLEFLSIPSSITHIPRSAFRRCGNLSKISLHDGIISIGEGSFDGTGFESFTIPPKVTDLSPSAFMSSRLRSVHLHNDIVSIGEAAFSGSHLCSIMIPSSITRISRAAFENCKELKTIELGSGVESIGDRAFCGSSLESITLPPRVTELSESLFESCKSLKKIELGQGIKTIQKCAIYKCSSLKSIVLPASVICTDNFSFCPRLEKVDLCGGSPHFAPDTFVNSRKLDSSDIISTGKMSFETFQRIAKAHLSRRMKPQSAERNTLIRDKFSEISGVEFSGTWSTMTYGLVPRETKQKLSRINGLITYWELKDSLPLLELAIWKSNLNDDMEQTAEMRQRRRRECGTDIHIIMNCVLEFFDYNNDD